MLQGPGLGAPGFPSTGMSPQQVQAVMSHLTAATGTGQVSELSGCPGGPVLLGLNPGEEQLARRFASRFGRDLLMTVGLTFCLGRPGQSPLCGSLEPSAPLPKGVHLALDLDHENVHSGAQFNGKVVVSEQGPGSFLMDTGQPLQAVIVRSGTLQVVGVLSEGVAGTGFAPRLALGSSGTIPVVGGTARCDGGVGSAVPPGTYQAVVRAAPETSPHTPAYLTPATTIHVTG